MKLGYVHDLPSASEAELPLELAIQEVRTKKHEVLPTKASQEAELALEYVFKEAPTKNSQEVE